MLKILAFAVFLFLPIYSAVYAADPLDIVINEIAWMGTNISYNDEWIELYNMTDAPVDLEGWILRAEDGTPEINLTGTILAKSFYLLERTNDDTVPGVSADLIYKGALGNKGEGMKIYNGLKSLGDEVNCVSGWFAGDNSTKQTMERTGSVGWESSQRPGGTPGAENSMQGTESLPITDSLTDESVIYPAGIIFNEVFPSPEGFDSQKEWIELYNSGDKQIDISGWYMIDEIGQPNSYIFPEKTIMDSHSHLVLSRTDTKIVLNNDEDRINLLWPNGTIADAINYSNAVKGQSYNRAGGGWAWSASLTPGSNNIIIPCPEVGSNKKLLLKDPEVKIQKGFDPAVSHDKVSINEFLPSPEGPDAEGEWVELYNSGEEKISLSGWSIQDIYGKTKKYIFPENTFIESGGYLVISRSASKITLNNDEEGISLYNPLGEIDSIIYQGKSFQGQSYAKKNDGTWGWALAPTPGEENIFNKKEYLRDASLGEGDTIVSGKKSASLINSLNNANNSLLIIFIAVFIALASGFIILLLKKKMELL